MAEILPGLYEQWDAHILAAFSCAQQGDFSCLSLPYGTLELSIDNHDRRFEPQGTKVDCSSRWRSDRESMR